MVIPTCFFSSTIPALPIIQQSQRIPHAPLAQMMGICWTATENSNPLPAFMPPLRRAFPSFRAASIHDLPAEIVQAITDEACDEDPRTSACLRMVASAFHDRASRHVFQNVYVARTLAADRANHAFPTPQVVTDFFKLHPASWRQAVRRLTVTSTTPLHSELFVQDGLALISLFSNLELLILQDISLLDNCLPPTCPHRHRFSSLEFQRCTISTIRLDYLLSMTPTVTNLTLDRCRIPKQLPNAFVDEPEWPTALHILQFHVIFSDDFSLHAEYPPFVKCPSMHTLKVSRIKTVDMTKELAYWIHFMCLDQCTTLNLDICKILFTPLTFLGS